jgi:hypothetical protein
VTNRSLLTEHSNVDDGHRGVDPVEFCGRPAFSYAPPKVYQLALLEDGPFGYLKILVSTTKE